jgi:hypothetical protein
MPIPGDKIVMLQGGLPLPGQWNWNAGAFLIAVNLARQLFIEQPTLPVMLVSIADPTFMVYKIEKLPA